MTTKFRAKRREKSPTDKLLRELRGRIVEACLDAARERRKAEKDKAFDGGYYHAHLRLAEVAALHSLELAEKHLVLQGEP